MEKLQNNDNEGHQYRAQFDFTYGNKYYQNIQGWLNHNGATNFKLKDLYCFKINTSKIEFDEFETNYLNQIISLGNMKNYKFTTMLSNNVKRDKDNNPEFSDYENTAITIATTHIKDILTPNFPPNTK